MWKITEILTRIQNLDKVAVHYKNKKREHATNLHSSFPGTELLENEIRNKTVLK